VNPQTIQAAVSGFPWRWLVHQLRKGVATEVSLALLPPAVVAARQQAEPTQVAFPFGHGQELLLVGQVVQPEFLEQVLDDVLVAVAGQPFPQSESAEQCREGVIEKAQECRRGIWGQPPGRGIRQGRSGHWVSGEGVAVTRM